MKGFRFLSSFLLILCLQAGYIRALPVVGDEEPPPEVEVAVDTDAEVKNLEQQLAASGISLTRTADDDTPATDPRQQSPLAPKKPVQEMDLSEMLEFQDQLKGYLTYLENKEHAARERERLREKEAQRRKQAQKIIAIRQLKAVEADLDDLLIRQAMRGAGIVVPPPKATGQQHQYTSEQTTGEQYSTRTDTDDDGYTDYVIDAPVVVTGKPAKRIKVRVRRNVMELHQQIQDLNQVLINDVTRMTGKPF